MQNEINTILSRINNKKTRLNIATTATHEGFSWMLNNIPHDFHLLTYPNCKQWNFQTRSLPPNHFLHLQPVDRLPGDLHFDLLLCQNKTSEFGFFKNIQRFVGCPLLVLNHTTVPPGLNEKAAAHIKTLRGDLNIFITDASRKEWGDFEGDITIRHGIDEEVFCDTYTGEINKGVSVVNFFPERDVFCGWNIWKEITAQVPCHLIGENNHNLSKSINDPKTLAKTLGSYRFFLNTSLASPLPLSVCEACSVGLPLVSTAQHEIPNIFTHGVDSFLSNDTQELIRYSKILMEDKALAYKMGKKAQETIRNKFSSKAFVENWNNSLWNAYNRNF